MSDTANKAEIHKRLGEIEAQVDRLEYERENLRQQLREEWDDE